jgi:catechol 2,3-dioxygenase-like lactoylglutathione lyase family enzyme
VSQPRALNLRAATPMIHVLDVRATVAWYEAIGFTVVETYDNGSDGLSFAILAVGGTRVMFNQGGHPSIERRREVDPYVDVEDVDQIFAALENRVEVVKLPHDTDYGMRECIIRDPNRFWVTFGQLLRER